MGYRNVSTWVNTEQQYERYNSEVLITLGSWQNTAFSLSKQLISQVTSLVDRSILTLFLCRSVFEKYFVDFALLMKKELREKTGR